MTVSFEDFQKLDLRIGEVVECTDHPNADNLLLLQTDVGDKKIQLVAGLKGHYTPSELEGRKIVVLVNLEPATLRGEKSEGMLLAADGDDGVSLLQPDADVAAGTNIL